MPEEQSVRARDGAADPHGCENSLRSGIPFLTLHLIPKRWSCECVKLEKVLFSREWQALCKVAVNTSL